MPIGRGMPKNPHPLLLQKEPWAEMDIRQILLSENTMVQKAVLFGSHFVEKLITARVYTRLCRVKKRVRVYTQDGEWKSLRVRILRRRFAEDSFDFTHFSIVFIFLSFIIFKMCVGPH